MANLLWFIVAVVLVFWLVGAIAQIGGSLIHLLLIVALVIVAFSVFSGRRI